MLAPRGGWASVIDLHSHVLHGIDDGPSEIEGSLAIARAAAAVGIRTLVATPHVSWRYPNTAEVIGRLVLELNDRLAAETVPLEVRAGAEIAMTRVGEIAVGELGELDLGGGGWILLEPPFAPVASGLKEIVDGLQRRGHRILLAHPERCPAFHRDPALLEELVRAGALTSVTAGSLIGRFGEQPRSFALSLAMEGLMHNVASDAHDPVGRAPGLRDEIEQAGLAPLTSWLTEEVPAAILEGQERVPPRPSVELGPAAAGRRSRWRLARRS